MFITQLINQQGCTDKLLHCKNRQTVAVVAFQRFRPRLKCASVSAAVLIRTTEGRPYEIYDVQNVGASFARPLIQHKLVRSLLYV